jgi:hypothetical protein
MVIFPFPNGRTPGQRSAAGNISGVRTLRQRHAAWQQVVYGILKSATEIKTHGISLHLQWIPGHCSNAGNDAADRLAKEAVGPNTSHSSQHSLNGDKRLLLLLLIKFNIHMEPLAMTDTCS